MTSRSLVQFRPVGSNEPESKPLTAFHRFTSLPPELRFMVWGEAFKSIGYDNPREWELVLRDALNGGAVVVKSDREDTPVAAGPSRDLYIANLRLACKEAKYFFETHMITKKIFTPAPCMVYEWGRYSLVPVPMAKTWICPEYDCWMFNFEFNSLGHPGGHSSLPLFDEWTDDLGNGGNQRVIDNSLVVLDSIRHLRIGFQALAGYTEHDLDAFLASLPRLSRISIHLEPIPRYDVPGRFHRMISMWRGGDFSYENRHFAAHCFFEELAQFQFTNGMVEVPESATRDIDVPDEEVLASDDYKELLYSVFESIEDAARPNRQSANGIQHLEYVEFIDRWVALGDRGVERVLVTRITSAQRRFGRHSWEQRFRLMLTGEWED
ncbi:hypothetical protein PGQ11_012957 [Apiospora arundinis]|uniref:2EXR domain-containing protein n=1 Tax=Apiospora arundinis TaxID=335852 RepID=A0ABR2I664_9PEZI